MKHGHIFRHSSQRGFVLLDAVIAILIFSIGILGMVALQGTAVKLAGDAIYRSNAAMLADQVIAQMWGSDLTTTGALGTAFAGTGGVGGTGGPMYKAWAATIDCTSTTPATGCLPGAVANPPIITAVSSASPSGAPVALVTVTVSWQAPNDTGPHNYVTFTQLSH
ncbi:MAG: hypothetical protein ABI858_01850 [Pseudoxanthomonas sp.]